MIKVENVSYTYTPGGAFEKVAVRSLCFQIEKGTFCGIIGHTGSGKTTLMQMLAGLLAPTEGTIYVDGINLSEKKQRAAALKGKVGIVFQYPEYQLFADTVLDDILFGPRNMGMGEKEARESAEQAIHAVGLSTAVFEKSPFSLSGGQKRRVAIAGVLAMQPDILILDEPTAGLDPRGRNEIIEKIQHLHEKEQKTILWVTHSMEDIARIASRILVMHDGKLAMDGTPKEVFSQGDALLDIGLEVPEITRVMHALRARGIPIDDDIYTIEAARDAILSLRGDM